MKQPELEAPPTEINSLIKEPTQNNADKISLPIWAWFVFIGIALAVSGGVAAFIVIMRKK